MGAGRILIVAGAIALGLVIVLMVVDAQNRQAQADRNGRIFADIVEGKTLAGALHADRGQFLCFDRLDAFRGRFDADDSGVQGATSAIRNQLIAEGRCTVSAWNDSFDMTADGRERFVTPSGSIELWAGS